MELTPRTGPDADGPEGGDGATRTADRPGAPPKRRILPIVVLVVVLLAGGFVVLQALGSAATFYRNVDEAVAQQESLGTKRFRLQGTVVPGSITRTGDGVNFDVTYNGVELSVRHRGDPPEMFAEDEPVLLEGRFLGDGTTTYVSDLIIVKHDEDYIDRNEDRLRNAEEGGSTASGDGASSNRSSEADGP